MSTICFGVTNRDEGAECCVRQTCAILHHSMHIRECLSHAIRALNLLFKTHDSKPNWPRCSPAHIQASHAQIVPEDASTVLRTATLSLCSSSRDKISATTTRVEKTTRGTTTASAMKTASKFRCRTQHESAVEAASGVAARGATLSNLRARSVKEIFSELPHCEGRLHRDIQQTGQVSQP